MLAEPIRIALLATLPLLMLLQGCASLVAGAQRRLAAQLEAAALAHDDPRTVQDGLAAFLLLADAGVQGAPKDPAALCAAAGSYGSYATAFVVGDRARAERLSERALAYADRAACAAGTCGLREARFEEVAAWADAPRRRPEEIECLGAAWAAWLQVRGDDVLALADLPKIRHLYERLAALDPDRPRVQLTLGVLNSLLPEALGGRPETGRQHFERALADSAGQDLMAKLMYARHYARLVFDQELHDRLLGEVEAGPVEAGPYTLGNALAKAALPEAIASGREYF